MTVKLVLMTSNQKNILENEFPAVKDPMAQSGEQFEKIYQQIEFAWEDSKQRIVSCQISV